MCWDGSSGSWHEWEKTGRRRRFGYFGGGELETTDLGSGIGVHSSVYLYFDGFSEPRCWGFYLRLVDMSSPRSETEWINLSTGPSYTPPRRAWG
jgi:hypothetical protein